MSSEIPQGVIVCDEGAFFAQCPECGEQVRLRKNPRRFKVRTIQGELDTEHTDVDVEPFEKHYRAEHT